MKLKTKSILAIIGTLLIGFVLGFMSNIFFVKSRFNEVRDYHKKGRMIDYFIRKLDLNDEQQLLIEPVLKKYNAKLKKNSEETKIKIIELMDSLKTELEPFLTEEQMEALNSRHKKYNYKSRKKN
ncbi:MAG: hypothetical protein PVH88_05055 [Ignavibacteria bacterium]|jgi:hypothetical protein